MIENRRIPATRPRRRAPRSEQLDMTLAYCIVMGLSLAVVGSIAVLSLTL